MRLADVIRRLTGNVVKDVNAAVAANVGASPGSVHVASSHRRTHVVQHGAETQVYESEESRTEGRT